MFEHFTFGAQPQTPHRHLLDDAFPSPTDTSFPSPLTPPPSSFPFPWNPQHQADISDIVAKFSQQTLQQQSRDQLVHDFQTWQQGNDDAATFAPPEIGDDDVDMEDTDQDDIFPDSERITKTVSLPSTSVSPRPPSSLACRRLQRQLNVQLQTSTTHIRDIGALVDGMIASESQCTLRQSTSTYRAPLSSQPHPPQDRDRAAMQHLIIDTSPSALDTSRAGNDLEIDEGFCDGETSGREEEVEFSLRRASTPSGIRKYNGVGGAIGGFGGCGSGAGPGGAKYGRSSDVVNMGARCKVRSLPRMRMRKVSNRVPE